MDCFAVVSQYQYKQIAGAMLALKSVFDDNELAFHSVRLDDVC